jgi:hypothetical protein
MVEECNESACRLFADERPASDFDFGAETAAVFDDMLERSVPANAESSGWWRSYQVSATSR